MDYYDSRDDLDDLSTEVEDISPIRDFYNDATVLITGGSGFFGKVLLEKLLRTCTGVKKIYLLLRPKRGKTAVDRMKEQFNDTLFDKLREVAPNHMSKVELIEGDCAMDRIGLSDANYAKILKEVNVIFHAAASLRMDEHLREAFAINVTATKFILEMVRNMPQLKSMIHFSTAYTHGYRNKIKERFYPVNFSAEETQQLLDSLDDWQIGAITSQVVGKWMNTYGFTKALAENTVQRYVEEYDLPVAVARPSIVVSTYKDPFKAWINNVYGATGVLAGAALGVLHTFYCDKHKLADLIPVDYVIHASIAAAWEVSDQRRKAGTVYNLVSTHYHKDLTWDTFMKYNEGAHKEQHLESYHAIWPYSFRLQNNRLLYDIECFQMHFIPAVIFDTILRLTGKEPMLLKTFRKVTVFVSFFFPYCQKEWDYDSDNVSQLYAKLTDKEKQMFFFDITKVEWNDFFWYYMRGLRLYIIKDDFKSLNAARKRSSRMRLVHYTLLGSIYAVRAFVVYFVLKIIYSYIKRRFDSISF